jgi:hypothetical protein
LIVEIYIKTHRKRKLGADPPYVKKIPPPRKSRFSHDQQKRYVYLYKKYAHRASVDTTEEERSEIRELQVTITLSSLMNIHKTIKG